MADLRAIGCPDLTIFDIVSAEVDEIFNAKVKELVDGVTGNFWNLVISSKDMHEMVEQKEKELEGVGGGTQRVNESTSIHGDGNEHVDEISPHNGAGAQGLEVSIHKFGTFAG